MTNLRIVAFIVASTLISGAEARRLEVLFLGDREFADSLEGYRILKESLSSQGFNFTYIEDLSAITRSNLDPYDALVVSANYTKEPAPAAIVPWVQDGGGLLALTPAATTFAESSAWTELIDASPRETIVAGKSWTRTAGKGRVYFTPECGLAQLSAAPEPLAEVKRAILWSIGDKKAAEFAQLKLPPLTTEIPEIANRTHPEVPMMELQKPLSPADSAAHTQVPVGTRLELFACEPMIVNPIAIDWDHKGRAWVIESFGYPNQVPEEPGSGSDTIKILEDSDHDGKADKMTVFARGLRHCTTSVFVKNGVVITDGKDIVYLGDDNGDDQADTRKVLASGLGIFDTHASTSHFQYGLDNWIYATCGYSGLDLTVAGKRNRFGQAVFRFRPDLSQFERLQNTTNNTWGLGLTELGDIIGSTANNNPSWMLGIPAAAYVDTGIAQPKTPRLDTSVQLAPKSKGEPQAAFVKMFTNTRDVTQVDQIAGYTAAAGHQFYNDTVMAGIFSAKNAFICEPTGHIVATAVVSEKGALKETALRGNNAFASSDAWAAPVAARVGPDGALWIADWYNPIIQHNVVFRYFNPARNYDTPHSPFQAGEAKGPGKGNAYETPLRDVTHGRIWRIVPTATPLRPAVADAPKNLTTQLRDLSSPSQLIRLQAQRQIVEQRDPQAVAPLIQKITEQAAPTGSDLPLTAIHAIWALEGMGAAPGSPSHEALVTALKSPRLEIRRHASLALGVTDPATTTALADFINQAVPPRELLLAMIQVALSAPNPTLGSALWKMVSKNEPLDPAVSEATQLAMRHQGLALFSENFTDISPEPPQTWSAKEALQVITRLAAGPKRDALVAFSATAPPGLRSHIERILAAPPVRDRLPVEVPHRFVAGRDIYMKVCIECHQADGTGVAGTFPPLLGSEWVKGDEKTLIRLVLGGLMGPITVKGQTYNGAMPGHSAMPDDEVAQILNFVRFAFGEVETTNLTPKDVKNERDLVAARKFTPWSVKDLQAVTKP